MLTWLERRESLTMIWPAVLTVALFMAAFFFIILPDYRADLLNGNKEMLRELTHTAWDLVASIEELLSAADTRMYDHKKAKREGAEQGFQRMVLAT